MRQNGWGRYLQKLIDELRLLRALALAALLRDGGIATVVLGARAASHLRCRHLLADKTLRPDGHHQGCHESKGRGPT